MLFAAAVVVAGGTVATGLIEWQQRLGRLFVMILMLAVGAEIVHEVED
jgi:hypothetical protein